MSGERDDDLRRRFQSMRAKEERGAPPFAVPPSRERHRPGYRVRLTALGLATLLVVWLLLAPPSRNEVDDFAQLDHATWVGPTDFLLRTPGQRFLATVPSIGAGAVAARTPPDAQSGDTTYERRRS